MNYILRYLIINRLHLPLNSTNNLFDMKRIDFYNEIKQALELDDKNVNEKTPIHLSSLQILSLIAFTDEKFEKQIKIVDLAEVKNISDLMTLIGLKNFTD